MFILYEHCENIYGNVEHKVPFSDFFLSLKINLALTNNLTLHAVVQLVQDFWAVFPSASPLTTGELGIDGEPPHLAFHTGSGVHP